MTMRTGTAAACGAILASGLVLGGCLASGSSSVRTQGQYVSGDTLELIDQGRSTERELLDLLGPPTRTMKHHDGRTVYVYQYSLDASSSGSVFLIAGGSSRSQVERTTYFEVRNGVVTRYWTDGAGANARAWAEEGCEDAPDQDFEEVS